MAFNTIDLAFIKQYEAEVHEAYQRRGSKLRGTVRTKTGVQGSSVMFQKVGKGEAVTKARNAIIAAMNIDHSNVECVLQDWYAGDWVDKFDLLKVAHDERRVVSNAGAYALGRKTDTLILTALATAGAGQTVPNGAGGLADTAGLTDDKIFAALELMNNADVPDDGRRFAIISPTAWSSLMQATTFTSADYVNDMPYGGGATQIREWLGVKFMMHSGLTTTSGLNKNFFYHSDAVGHAIASEVVADVTWHGDRASWWVNHMMSQGACLIDATGVVIVNMTPGGSVA